MNTQYVRVIPRDLFNEAKLLKCIGRLVLLIHEGNGLGLTFEHDGDPFQIGLHDDGYLSIANLYFSIGIYYMPTFKVQYNSKDNYNLFCEHDTCEYLVFDEDGNYTQEFKDLCENLRD